MTTKIRVKRSRHTDPVTSHEAADRLSSESTRRVRVMVRRVMAEYPEGMTDELLREECMKIDPSLSESSPRKRRGEMVDDNEVELVRDDNGAPVVQMSRHNRRMFVWRLSAR